MITHLKHMPALVVELSKADFQGMEARLPPIMRFVLADFDKTNLCWLDEKGNPIIVFTYMEDI